MSEVFGSLRDGTTADCLSDLTLDCLNNNELPPDARERAEQHLRTCARCQSQGRALQASSLDDAELPLLAARTRRAAASTASPTPVTPSRVLRVARWFAPIAIAAGLAAALFWKPGEASTQVKGGDSLILVVKRRDGHVERVTEGATLFAKEQVRFSLDVKASAFVVLLSVDEEGKVSVFTPEPLALGKGAEQLLETTVQLDASEGAERFFAVLCEQPRAVPALVAAAERELRAAGNQPERVHSLESGCRETSVLVHKQR